MKMQHDKADHAVIKANGPASKSSIRKDPNSRKERTDEEASDWRDRYVGGESYAKIARSVGRSPHTVKSRIQRLDATQERTAVRREAMKQAFVDHIGELLALLGAIRKEFASVTVPVVGLRGRARDAGKPFGPFNIPDPDADDLQVAFDLEDARQWKLLAEHLGRDAAMRAIDRVRKVAATLAKSELELKKRIEAGLTEVTGLGIYASAPGKPWIPRVGVAAVLDASCQAAAGRDARLRSMAANLRAQEKSIVYSGTSLVEDYEDPAPILPLIAGVVMGIPATEAFRELKSVIADYAAATEKASEEISVLESAHFLSGECRACRRLGM